MKIPEFKNTLEALVFGLSYFNDKKIIQALQFRMWLLTATYYLACLKRDVEACFSIAFRRQFVREAWEAATGKMPVRALQHVHAETYCEAQFL